jgi:hypothetical protein
MNPFEQAGQRKPRNPLRISKPPQPMKPSAMEKNMYDKAKQLTLFRKWKCEIRQSIIDGKYQVEIIMLLRLLRRTPDAGRLLQWINDAKWLLDADLKVRQNVLSWIDDALVRYHVRHGLAPYNDGLPGEDDPPFVVARKLLVGRDLT